MEEVRFCAWCGKIVNLKFHYCPWCGKNLYKAEDTDLIMDRVVKEMTRLQKDERLATLEKMEDQLGTLDEEISALMEESLHQK